MFYAVLVSRGDSKAEQLADALSANRLKPASVYVVGLSDANAFASALLDGTIEIDSDLNAEQALKFEYVHAIGTEDGSASSLMLLTSAARNLVEEINAAGGHKEYSAKLARFSYKK